VCQGIFFVVTDREALRPVRLGAEIAAILVRLYGASIDFGRSHLLVGSSEAVAAIRAGQGAAAAAEAWPAAEERWRSIRAQYLLY